jgi:hypothetical protein
LNLGSIGLFLFVALIISTFGKIRRGILTDFQFGRLRLAFLAAIVIYNWTEVSFRGPHALWLIFYIIAIEYPDFQFASIESDLETGESEHEKELVYSSHESGIDRGLGVLKQDAGGPLVITVETGNSRIRLV